MAKSILASRVGGEPSKSKRSPTLSIKLNVARHMLSYNLLDWAHSNLDPSQPLIKARKKRMVRLYDWVIQQQKDNISDSSIQSHIITFRQYLRYCDFKNKEPFSKNGYLSYLSELWRQVDLAKEPKLYLFLYDNNDELGIQELSAANFKDSLDKMMRLFNINIEPLQVTLKIFSQSLGASNTSAYTPKEWYQLIKRTQVYFDSLADKLIEHAKQTPYSPPPSVLSEVAITAKKEPSMISSVGDIKYDGPTSPFNQCMTAGYVLFCYYTAFNDSVVHEVRHPLSFSTTTKEDRTIEHAVVRAYKGRAYKDVEALFSDESEEIKPATDKDAGFIEAPIQKSHGKGFIEKLEKLSKAYSNDKYGNLFYSLDRNGEKKRLNIIRGLMILATILHLTSERKDALAEHYISLFNQIIQEGLITKWKAAPSDVGFRKASKISYPIAVNKRRAIAINYAFIALNCLTNLSIKNIIMPLRYSHRNSSGNITVSCNYLNGTPGTFEIPKKYQNFLEQLEEYSRNYATKKQQNNGLAFLLPLGTKFKSRQWQGWSPLSCKTILGTGISNGDFFLSITSTQIRKTNSDLEYKPETYGIEARNTLQHSKETQDKHYPNGHPQENSQIFAQGLRVIEWISTGISRDEAKVKTKSEFKVKVLAYDEYKALRQPTNANGILCDGKPKLISGKNEHLAAIKFLESHNALNAGQDISCYQFDLCIFCKSAQLVDDVHSVYKLLSFMDALADSLDLNPERREFIAEKLIRFEVLIENLPTTTINQALNKFHAEGRYYLFSDIETISHHT